MHLLQSTNIENHIIKTGKPIINTTFPSSLTDDEVKLLQKKYGPNHLLDIEEDNLPLTLITVLKKSIKEIKSFLYEQIISQPLILLLLASALVSALLGQIENSISIMIAILIVGSVAYIQERRTTNCLDALALLSPSMCRVYRRSSPKDLEPTLRIEKCSSLVPGDLIQMAGGGDVIPADIKWISHDKDDLCHLRIDESILTGESKNIEVRDGDEGWMGTSVLQGSGFATVINTGHSTKLGKIKSIVEGVKENSTDGRSPLQEHLDWLGGRLATMSLIIIGLLTLLAVTPLGGSLGWIDAITQAISLAVAAIPEGMPVVATITLALCQYRLGKYNNITVKTSSAIEGMGSISVLCMDKTGTITLNKLRVSKTMILDTTLFDIAITHCNSAVPDINGVLRGNSVDIALLEYSMKNDNTRYSTCIIEPFTSLKKKMTVLVNLPMHGSIQICKGAPEVIMEGCSSLPEGVEEFCSERASLGERVIAISSLISDANGSGTKSLIGLISLEDPIRDGAILAIEGLLKAGIAPIIVTGDHLDTALAIAKRISFPVIGPLISGKDLGKYLASNEKIILPSIVYRSRPEDKLDLIKWIKEKYAGTVAMTGDGVNDGPALQASHVSIGIGGGAEVAQKASNMILKEGSSLVAIVDAIIEGRHLSDCMGNFVRFQLCISISSLLLVGISLILSNYLPLNCPTPLNALQILLINIIMDGPPAQALGLEPLDSISRNTLSIRGPLSPANQRKDLLGFGILLRIIGMSLHISLLCLWELIKGGNGNNFKDAQSRTFTLFVLCSLVCAFCCRQRQRRFSLYKLLTGNKTLFYTVIASFIGLLSCLWIPALSRIIQSPPLSPYTVIILLLKSMTLLIHEELVKFYINFKKNDGYIEL